MPCGLILVPNLTSPAELVLDSAARSITASSEDARNHFYVASTDREISNSPDIPSVVERENSQEDGDGQYSDLQSDDESSTQSLGSTVKACCEENGRTYHSYKQGRYPLPNDEDEQERLDLQHELFLIMHDRKLLLCPADLSKAHRILDLGTGTGIWAMDFADHNPQLEVIGVDLSPIQPTFVPPNLHFILDDIEDEWLYGSAQFDVIHGRMLNHSIRNWPHLFKQSFDYLKPGGYVEFVCMSPNLKLENGSTIEGSALKAWSQAVLECYVDLGIDVDCEAGYQNQLVEAGFKSVVEVQERLPLNAWPNEQHEHLLGRWSRENMLMGLSGFSLAPFTRAKRWQRTRVETMLIEVRKEIKNTGIHAYWPIYVVYARKPTTKMEESNDEDLEK
ncbi:S-adenosyl-L-methionine-dependent methyltransferase [Cadophora sp. DSE1049]|nr:S-adenosyl-L-methionine-dependent methyltransferase [Cadophora sp. DSE1049]